MMGFVFAGLIVVSVVVSFFTGRVSAVTQAAVGSCVGAVQLFLTLAAGICFWNGIMRVARDAGITDKLARLLRPVIGALFHSIRDDTEAITQVSMNLAANLMGLGNAATPFGIAAMRRFESRLTEPDTASKDMVTFVVMNSVSIQLIPSTVALLRLQSGSEAPFSILPAVWAAAGVSLLVGVVLSRLFGEKRRRSRAVCR